MSNPRLEKLYVNLYESQLNAIALNPGPTLIYLTGAHFHLMERPVVFLAAVDRTPAIVLPELEMLKVEQMPYSVQAFPYGENPSGWEKAFRSAAQALGLVGKRVGVEPGRMRLLEYHYLRVGAPGAEFPDAGELLGALRLRKEPGEVESMRKAVGIAQSALEATLPAIRIGMTEKELAAELTLQLFRHGSEAELPFAPIVSGGPNAANPHAAPGERKLQPGDMLVIDWGANADGYISDLTRTFAVGRVDAEFARIHQVVQAANAAGRAAGKPGVPCAEVDRAARAVIEAAGYGEYFTHRTGHGIGMEAHEAPYMRGDNLQLLETGMTYTVEPGIYLAGRNGVRVEDDMVVTEGGSESLSDMPREMRVVG
ncbi:MAG: Xaa-Pro peptidase family protein [Chloroflexi bacterium]|nr:Xaa-Pro peptidase family protein [Chloroflexota bacterium]